MPWFKVDDGLAFNPKVVAAGNAAMGLWVRAGAYCAAHLTDGRLPRAMLAPLGGRARDAQRLVDCGLWTATDDGWQFHEWEQYQPTKAQVEHERKATAERVAAWRERQRNGERNGVTHGASSSVGTPAPTRPDPTHKDSPNGESGAANAATTPPTPKIRTRGTRLPEPFQVTPDMVTWARENTPGLDHKAVTAAFCDYWRAQPGQKGVKVDWPATWRNWMRRELEHHGGRPATDTPRPGASVWERRVTSGGAQ